MTETAPIVVTGANGLVGAAVARELSDRGVPVRAVVRREGSAPKLPGVEEVVGEFHDEATAKEFCDGAASVVHTVHPMGDDDLQESAVGWAESLARAARDAGVELFVHVSTTSVYERDQHTGDVDEDSALARDDDNLYSVTKRDTERALEKVDGMTRVFVRPTAILGPGESSVWNTLRPNDIREHEQARRDDPERTFGWVHLSDLARLIADVATGAIAPSQDPDAGPVPHQATAVNAVSGNVPLRDYLTQVAKAVGVEPLWETRPAFRAKLLAERARDWGWEPKVTFDDAMTELLDGLK